MNYCGNRDCPAKSVHYEDTGYYSQPPDEPGRFNRPPPSRFRIYSDPGYAYHTQMGPSLTVTPVSPADFPTCTCDHGYSYSFDPRPHYHEREYFYEGLQPEPIRRRHKLRPVNLQEFATNCVGSAISGTSSCLVGVLEVCAAVIGGVCEVCKPKRRRRLQGAPYSWKYYDIGNYEYDMVVYRRPRPSWCERMFDC